MASLTKTLNDPPQRDGVYPPETSDDLIEAYYGPGGGELSAASVATEPFNVKAPKGQTVGQTLGTGTRKVGWTVRDASGTLLRAFAFNINPQSISRAYTSRTQLFATRGAFYVDDFGQGPTTITLTQMVGSGQKIPGTQQGRTTARYDVVVGFYENIYKYVVEESYSDKALVVRFHDNHWKVATQEKIYFPANSLTVQRAVDQHNVWQVQLQMISLESFREVDTTGASSGSGATKPPKVYQVKRGDTLHKIIYKALGASRTHPISNQAYQAFLNKVISLNKAKDDIAKTREAPIYNGAGVQIRLVKVKRLQLYPGERLLLPG